MILSSVERKALASVNYFMTVVSGHKIASRVLLWAEKRVLVSLTEEQAEELPDFPNGCETGEWKLDSFFVDTSSLHTGCEGAWVFPKSNHAELILMDDGKLTYKEVSYADYEALGKTERLLLRVCSSLISCDATIEEEETVRRVSLGHGRKYQPVTGSWVRSGHHRSYWVKDGGEKKRIVRFVEASVCHRRQGVEEEAHKVSVT